MDNHNNQNRPPAPPASFINRERINSVQIDPSNTSTNNRSQYVQRQQQQNLQQQQRYTNPNNNSISLNNNSTNLNNNSTNLNNNNVQAFNPMNQPKNKLKDRGFLLETITIINHEGNNVNIGLYTIPESKNKDVNKTKVKIPRFIFRYLDNDNDVVISNRMDISGNNFTELHKNKYLNKINDERSVDNPYFKFFFIADSKSESTSRAIELIESYDNIFKQSQFLDMILDKLNLKNISLGYKSVLGKSPKYKNPSVDIGVKVDRTGNEELKTHDTIFKKFSIFDKNGNQLGKDINGRQLVDQQQSTIEELINKAYFDGFGGVIMPSFMLYPALGSKEVIGYSSNKDVPGTKLYNISIELRLIKYCYTQDASIIYKNNIKNKNDDEEEMMMFVTNKFGDLKVKSGPLANYNPSDETVVMVGTVDDL